MQYIRGHTDKQTIRKRYKNVHRLINDFIGGLGIDFKPYKVKSKGRQGECTQRHSTINKDVYSVLQGSPAKTGCQLPSVCTSPIEQVHRIM